jgi:fructokinase
MPSPSTDVLAIGELLIDLIGADEGVGLEETTRFDRFQGGSPANLCRTLALAGRRPALAACVGADGLGGHARAELAAHGVDTQYVATSPHAPTSLVVLARSAETAEFTVYRHADALIEPAHVPDAALRDASIVHTTCFALSRTPARSTILDAAARLRDAEEAAGEDAEHEDSAEPAVRAEHAGGAAGSGRTTLTLDANYAPAVWPDRFEAQGIVKEFCRYGPLVKVSSDDLARLFGEEPDGDSVSLDPAAGPDEAIARLHDWGAPLVCWTRGARGSVVSWEGGARREAVPAPEVEVVDATGAGDAFWAGFLHAWLRGDAPPDCARTGSHLAAQKLTHPGPLTEVQL